MRSHNLRSRWQESKDLVARLLLTNNIQSGNALILQEINKRDANVKIDVDNAIIYELSLSKNNNMALNKF